ncbi:uncharacterized protein BP5553_08461 [Venustampulla echinocandica]|uniref:DUF7730 domain-containing protein n=1 Tax=Venustampulla echinocandica TaxID=2656787 RepID=A0A370TEA1_9HELO|nr:uncharacterized protein BP5553_08461 [Venustampulla echinocandica]RDL33022.1 hypothetical protein BP5553_08461 [Venustampulla echinocandica]
MPKLLHYKQPQAPHLQSKSRLFSLPAELRVNIFTLALTTPRIYLTVKNLRNELCLALVTPGTGGLDVYVIRAQRLLSLLLTCRRAHAEALPILYGINTFLVGNDTDLRLLARGMGGPFVRQLEFSWTLYEAPIRQLRKRWTSWLRSDRLEERWLKAWEEIKHMELCWLQVELCVPGGWRDKWIEREAEILHPLVDILREGASGGLTLTWERDANANIGAEELLPKWDVNRREW